MSVLPLELCWRAHTRVLVLGSVLIHDAKGSYDGAKSRRQTATDPSFRSY